MNMQNPIVVISPMDSEFKVLSSLLEDKCEKNIGGYIFLEGRCGNCPVLLIRCLIGTINSAVSTTLAIKNYNPRCIILQGTSGAHDPALHKNDIVIADKVTGLDNCVSKHRDKGEGSDPFAWDYYGVQAYFEGSGKTEFVHSFSCDKSLSDTAFALPYEKGIKVRGTVAAADIWNKEADLILFHHEKQGTLCEAMEGFGVAQVCAAFNVPMTEIRIISNSELHPDEPFSEDTAENLQYFVWELVKELAKR